jgi:RHS repeat-associated protein
VGQRVQVTANGKTRQLVYDIFGQTIAEYGNGLLERENIYRGGQLLLVAESGISTVSVPTNLTTTPTSSNVAVNWTAATGATSYRIERKAAGGSFVSAGTTSNTSFTDNGVTAGNAYLYRVCVADGSGNCASGFSNVAFATVFSFTDPTLITIQDDPSGATVTSAKAVHITQLRTAVNAVRSLAGLSNATWSTTVVSGGTISKDDIKDLRDRLNDAFTPLTIPLPTYTDATLVGAPNGTLIKGAHIRELRQRVTSGVGGVSCTKSITQFIQNFYQGTLSRQPSISELSHWTAVLTQAQSQGVSQLLGAAQSLGATLFNSTEYTGTTHSNEAYVTDLYEGYLQRAPDQSGFTNWVNTLTGGASRAAVRQGFADSIEFHDEVIALCWTTVSSGGIRYVFSDLLGSARALMNNSGVNSSTVVARHDYLPYGEEIWAGSGLRSSTQGFGAIDNTSRRYAMTDRDNTTGLDHTDWREYDNFAGRFTSPDPYGGSGTTDNPQSFNRYTYTMNDPVNGVDPTGLTTCFGYFVILYRIEDGKIVDSEVLGFIPVYCWEDGPVGGGGRPGGGGNPVGPKPAGQQNNHAQKKSDCKRFVDDLIDEAMLDGVLGRLAVGRVLGGGVMLTNKLTDFYRNASTTGFKQKYIDHQGGYAYAHIQGMAGAYLIGGEPLLPGGTQTGLDRAQQQWDEDITQHADALVHHQPDLIAEKISELNDDQAGLDVGAILGNYIDGKTSRENARDQIFKMLCDF